MPDSMMVFIALTGAAVLVFLGAVRSKLSFWPVVYDFAVDRLPFHAAYYTMLGDSGVWGKLGVFRGLRDRDRTLAAAKRARNLCQLSKTDGAGFQLWETPFGDWWFPKGTAAKWVYFAVAQYEVDPYPGAPIRKGDIVLDGGGFIGDWTKRALEKGASLVVTFEPSPEAIEWIRRNLRAEIDAGRVILCQKGLWDQEGRLQLSVNEENPAASTVSDHGGNMSEWIDLQSLDAIVEELALDRVDVLKLDVEAAEVRALHGAKKTLNRFRPRLAVGTEHTDDMLQNSRNVVQAVREVAPFYKLQCGQCSLRRDRIIVPEALHFRP
jgi:FkbM family methyltransferase